MRKTLADVRDRSALRARLASVTATDSARFGRMTVGEMVCHLRTAYTAVSESRQLTLQEKMPLPPRILKWLALYAPLRWRPGVKSTRELEVGQPGTVPAEFTEDRASLLATFDRFAAALDAGLAMSPTHPMLGPMKPVDWQRWGWLHADHHLRQFGR